MTKSLSQSRLKFALCAYLHLCVCVCVHVTHVTDGAAQSVHQALGVC